jgi:AcrR family transcriptional regulator
MDSIDDQGRRARKRRQMLELLTRTAASLFERHGYESVTMEQIAEAADVAKRTLYNHFPTKEAVLACWLDAELERDLAGLQNEVCRHAGFRARVECVLSASAEWCEQHPTLLRAYLRYRLLNASSSEPRAGTDDAGGIVAAWRQLIAAGQEAGELDDSIDTEQLATWFHHLYFGAMLRWLEVPALSLRGEFEAITELFLNGASKK